MSHFNHLVTKITNKELLKQALRQQSEVAEVKENWYIRGWRGDKAKGDVVGILEGDYDIGFVFKNECFAVADFGYGTCSNSSGQSLVSLWQRIVATYMSLESHEQASKQRGLTGANVKVVVH